MKVPPGHTEQEVLDAIERSANILAPSFAFAYFTADDIRQQCYVFAFELLEKETYDASRPLANYIYKHIRNRLLNLRRDKLKRNDPPCAECHAGNPCSYGDFCDKYLAWQRRNAAKSNLVRPLDLENICDEREQRTRVPSHVLQDAETSELIKKIDDELPIEYRQIWKQIIDGCSVPKAKRYEVEMVIREILGTCLQKEDG